MSPASIATTGRPHAMASTTALGHPSVSDAWTRKRDCFNSSGTSDVAPISSAWPPRPRSCANLSREARSGPTPALVTLQLMPWDLTCRTILRILSHRLRGSRDPIPIMDGLPQPLHLLYAKVSKSTPLRTTRIFMGDHVLLALRISS